jgi:ureidoglycolate lyase
MNTTLTSQPITQGAFAPYGDVIEARGDADKMINQNKCGRYHDIATLDFVDGSAGISVFQSQCFTFPFTLEMMERHPKGSQAFLPMHQGTFLVVVAEDNNGTPSTPIAFVVAAGQGVNIGRNVWHGVLCPLEDPGLFAVVDRIGEGPNLEEYWFDESWTVLA